MGQKILLVTLSLLSASVSLSAQTPTLSLAAAKVGVNSKVTDSGNSFKFFMDPSGYPRAVTAGETIIMAGTWPHGNNPSFSDDKGNTWRAVFSTSCADGTGEDHGFFYAVNAAAGTSVITETHSSLIQDTVFDWMHFYDMATSSTGFVDGSSCRTGVTPSNNTAPNITGTPYTTTQSGDLILTFVFDEQKPLGPANPWTGITYPSGFTGLSDERYNGHAGAYGVQRVAGTFTPTFTVAQGTHDSFTIISVALRAGTGGTAPPSNQASVLLSVMHYLGFAGTLTVHVPCPTGTTNITAINEAGQAGASLSAVNDSGSNVYSHPTFNAFFPQIYYTNAPNIPDQNAFTVSLNMNTANGVDLIGIYCVGGTNGLDTGLAPANNSALTGSGEGATQNNPSLSNPMTDAPSGKPSVAGDLFIGAAVSGVGPATACANSSCVFDYVGATWSGANGGNQQSYSNGDGMAHFYENTAATVNFQYVFLGSTGMSTSMIALKPASQSTPPAPPSGLQAIVH
jgi:hypothetical protein